MVQLPVDGTLTVEAIETTLNHNLQVLSMDKANLSGATLRMERRPLRNKQRYITVNPVNVTLGLS